MERNHLGRGLRLSLSPFKEQDWVVNLPSIRSRAAARVVRTDAEGCDLESIRTPIQARNKGRRAPIESAFPTCQYYHKVRNFA